MNIFELLEDRMGDNDTIYVSPEEMYQLLTEMPVPYDPKPEPPVKAFAVSIDNRIFSKAPNIKSVEYDHHAPEYLCELEKWRERQEERSKRQASGVMEFVGPIKTYKIELKK